MMTTSVPSTEESSATSSESTTSAEETNATLPEAPAYEDELSGRCEQVPAGVHLTVIYKQAGENNNLPLFSIVGAKIRSGVCCNMGYS